MNGIALPRILTRTRRRKPRGPRWRWTAGFCAWWIVLFALHLLSGNVLGSAGCAMVFGCYWRELHRAPADPDAPPLTMREREVMGATFWAAMGLLLMEVAV